MNLHDLRQAQSSFSVVDAIEGRKQLNKLRAAFVKEFSLKHIDEMKIDEYVIGRGNETFCYRIERELDGLGRIIGANAFKFGVYYGQTKTDRTNKYRNTKIWGNSEHVAFNNVINAIIELIEAGNTNDTGTILRSRISPMFKGKILSVYYPDKYLNVFSDDHLKHYLKALDLDTKNTIKANPFIKREILVEFKNNDPVMKNWSLDLFSHFLYDYYPGRPIKKEGQIIDILKDYSEPEFPYNPKPEQISLQISNKLSASVKHKNPKGNQNLDYEKQNRINKKLGDRGEKIVEDFERENLIKLGKKDLAEKVDRVSTKSDNYGFDILSFSADGSKKHIEVKATRSKVGDANFFLTINELKTAIDKKETYYIYVVYEILTDKPKIWVINNPFFPENPNILMEPVNYKVSIQTKI